MFNPRKLLSLISLSFITTCVAAQQAENPAATPGDFMYGNGKIFVVMAVVVVIVAGLLIYLINLDRKITKLEKRKFD